MPVFLINQYICGKCGYILTYDEIITQLGMFGEINANIEDNCLNVENRVEIFCPTCSYGEYWMVKER